MRIQDHVTGLWWEIITHDKEILASLPTRYQVKIWETESGDDCLYSTVTLHCSKHKSIEAKDALLKLMHRAYEHGSN